MQNTSDNNDVYQKIQKVARDLFLERGYSETTIRDIAENVDIAPGTIYNYFKGKRDLFESLNLPNLDQTSPKKNKKRDNIINSALVLFGENGYEGVTMDDIAHKVGFTKAALYQYCKSKEDLFSQVLQQSSFNLFAKKIKSYSNAKKLDEVVKDIGRSYLEIGNHPERIALLRTVIRDSRIFPEIGLLYYERGFKAACDNIVDYLKKVLPTKNIYITDKELITAVHTYIGSLQSYILMHNVIYGIPLNINKEEYLDTATKVFIKSF